MSPHNKYQKYILYNMYNTENFHIPLFPLRRNTHNRNGNDYKIAMNKYYYTEVQLTVYVSYLWLLRTRQTVVVTSIKHS